MSNSTGDRNDAGPSGLQPTPGAAHYQTSGWGGVPGECGVECACGTVFDHFDTIAEAAALLDGHIAAANRPTSAAVAVRILAARAADAKRVEEIDRAHAAGELSSDEFKAALVAVSVTRFPIGYTLGPCPPWCVTDHAKHDNEERTEGLRGHSSEPTIIQCATHAGNTWAKVGVDVMDNLDTGVRDQAAVHVASGDALSPANARAFADAIAAAAELAEAWNR